MKKIISFLKKNLYVVILILFAIISHWQWFYFGNILCAGDWSYRSDELTRELYYSASSWMGFLNFGAVNIQVYFNLFFSIWSLLANIGLSYDTAVKITFLIPIATMGFLSPYFLIRKLAKDDLIGFISALFYGTGVYFIVRQTAHLPVAFIYSIAPLIFYLFIQALEKNNVKSWFYFTFLSWIGICYEVRMMYIVFFTLSLYFIFFNLKNVKKYLKYALLVIIVLILLNIYFGRFQNLRIH